MNAAGKALRWVRTGSPERTPEPEVWDELVALLDRLNDLTIGSPPRPTSRERAPFGSHISGMASSSRLVPVAVDRANRLARVTSTRGPAGSFASRAEGGHNPLHHLLDPATRARLLAAAAGRDAALFSEAPKLPSGSSTRRLPATPASTAEGARSIARNGGGHPPRSHDTRRWMQPDPRTHPTRVKAPRNARTLEITWADGHQGIYPHEILAGVLSVRRVPRSLGDHSLHSRRRARGTVQARWRSRAARNRAGGQLCLRFGWGDAHNTGLYSFRYLRSLCQCAECQPSGRAERAPRIAAPVSARQKRDSMRWAG